MIFGSWCVDKLISRKSPLPIEKPQFKVGFTKVRVRKVTKPVFKNYCGVVKQVASITFESVTNDEECTIECVCILALSSRLFHIFKAVNEHMLLEKPEKCTLESLVGKELIVEVEEVKKLYRLYRNIINFLPSDAKVALNNN